MPGADVPISVRSARSSTFRAASRDTLCHKLPNFTEKCKRAAVTRAFIGLENINPDNLAVAKKRQNKITEYRKMMLAWKAQGIMTLAGYIPPDDVSDTESSLQLFPQTHLASFSLSFSASSRC
jgi:hypothetical protein